MGITGFCTDIFSSSGLLHELVRKKTKRVKLSSNTLQPDKLKQFLEKEVELLWPEGWMQTSCVLLGTHFARLFCAF